MNQKPISVALAAPVSATTPHPNHALDCARHLREGKWTPNILQNEVGCRDNAANELERLHAENATLRAGYDAARLEIESLKARVQELGAALKKANAQAEQFERQWYLRGDEIEALQNRIDEVGRMARENRSRAVVDLEQEVKDLHLQIRHLEGQACKLYPFTADMYDSKDWRDGDFNQRIEWLRDSYQSAREEIERLTADVLNLQAMLDAVRAGGVEPLRKRECLHQIAEPQPFVSVPKGWKLVPMQPTIEMIKAAHGITGAMQTKREPKFRDEAFFEMITRA